MIISNGHANKAIREAESERTSFHFFSRVGSEGGGSAQPSPAFRSIRLHLRGLSRCHESMIYFPVSPLSKSFFPRGFGSLVCLGQRVTRKKKSFHFHRCHILWTQQLMKSSPFSLNPERFSPSILSSKTTHRSAFSLFAKKLLILVCSGLRSTGRKEMEVTEKTLFFSSWFSSQCR